MRLRGPPNLGDIDEPTEALVRRKINHDPKTGFTMTAIAARADSDLSFACLWTQKDDSGCRLTMPSSEQSKLASVTSSLIAAHQEKT
jgi:hypothetical protein